MLEKIVVTADGFKRNPTIIQETVTLISQTYISEPEFRENVTLLKTVGYIGVWYIEDKRNQEQCLECLCNFYKYNGTKIKSFLEKKIRDPTKLQDLFYNFQAITIKTSSKMPKPSATTVQPAHTASSSSLSIISKNSSDGNLALEKFREKYDKDLPPLNHSKSYNFSQIFDLITKDHNRNEQSENWEKRVKVLKQFRTHILFDQDTLSEFSQDIWKSYRTGFARLIVDPRSQIQSEAFLTVSLLAEKMPNIAEFMLEDMIEPCFANLKNYVKAVSAGSWHTLEVLLTSCQNSRVLPKILDRMSSKSPIDRQKVIESLMIVLTSWSEKHVQNPKYTKLLAQTIDQGINDGDSVVRQLSRQLFVSFEKIFPKEANTLKLKMSASQVKSLSDSKRPQTAITRRAPLRAVNPIVRPKTAGTKRDSSMEARSKAAQQKHMDRLSLQKQAAPLRSLSAIDNAAVKRSSNKKYANVQSKVSQNIKSPPRNQTVNNKLATPEKDSPRGRSVNRKSAISTPGSRTTSPLKAYIPGNVEDSVNKKYKARGKTPTRRSKIPVSRGGSRQGSRQTSRDQSPTGMGDQRGILSNGLDMEKYLEDRLGNASPTRSNYSSSSMTNAEIVDTLDYINQFNSDLPKDKVMLLIENIKNSEFEDRELFHVREVCAKLWGENHSKVSYMGEVVHKSVNHFFNIVIF